MARDFLVWDSFSDQHGKLTSANTVNVAYDHYQQYNEDIRLVAEIGWSKA